MTLDRFYKLCQLLGYLAVLAAALWCLSVAVNGQGTHYPRFHRYALTRLDDTTTLDMVKDAKTGVCRLVYRAVSRWSSSENTPAVTYLGEVPCDPAPVPPVKGDAPPASAVR